MFPFSSWLFKIYFTSCPPVKATFLGQGHFGPAPAKWIMLLNKASGIDAFISVHTKSFAAIYWWLFSQIRFIFFFSSAFIWLHRISLVMDHSLTTDLFKFEEPLKCPPTPPPHWIKIKHQTYQGWSFQGHGIDPWAAVVWSSKKLHRAFWAWK